MATKKPWAAPDESGNDMQVAQTEPEEPIAATAAVEGEAAPLSWGGAKGRLYEKETEPEAPAKMPDLSTKDAVFAHLKDNPSALWYMSKAELIAIIVGPEMAAQYAAGKPPPEPATV